METATPIQQSERNIIVDIIRGFALTGVLIANFTSYNYQQIPTGVLDSISSPLDKTLIDFNTIFFEWKFMTLFSILFGYGFGLILTSLEKKNINPNAFFLRRMFWLFVIGLIHTSFWWADVLHLYAMGGVLLLLFRKLSTRNILVCSFVFMFILAPAVSFVTRNNADFFTDQNISVLYEQYKHGNLFNVFRENWTFYYHAFIAFDFDVHDVIEALGRFLFGYYLLRIGLFDSVESKKKLFKRVVLVTAPIVIIYLISRWMVVEGKLDTSAYYWEPLKKLGIICTSCCYASILVIAFIAFGQNRFFKSLQALGKMTLTNYLMVSAFLIILLYGFGFGKLGELPMHIIWMYAAAWLAFETIFSTWWLSKFRYGPVEWIWRQLTYQKRIQLRK